MKIKNNTSETKVLLGQTIEAGEYYELQPLDLRLWSINQTILSMILSGELIVFDGVDIQDPVLGLNTFQNKVPKKVAGPLEVDDKTLKIVSGFASTDSSGDATFVLKVPTGGRYLCYGWAEFATRHLGDYVSKVEVTDLNRQYAWALALAINPNATQPLSDATIQAQGTYPLYPIVEHFDERSLTSDGNTQGTFYGGMAMKFNSNVSEAKPIGGPALIPGGLYIKIVATKKPSLTQILKTGIDCQLSLEWAKPK